MVLILGQLFRRFTVVWTRQEYYESWYSYLCDTYCCCIKGTYIRVYCTQNNRSRKWQGFRVDIEIDLVDVWSDEIDMILVWGSELTWFQCRDRNRLGIVCGSKTTWFKSWSKLTRFLCRGDRNWLFFRAGIEIDVASVLGAKLTWLRVWDRNWLDFREGIEINLSFERGSKLTCFFVRGSKMPCF